MLLESVSFRLNCQNHTLPSSKFATELYHFVIYQKIDAIQVPSVNIYHLLIYIYHLTTPMASYLVDDIAYPAKGICRLTSQNKLFDESKLRVRNIRMC